MLGFAIPGTIHLCLYLYQARMLQVLGRARHVTVFLMSAHNMTGPADQLRHCVWTARKRAVWMAMWDVDEVPARPHGPSAASVAPQLAALAAWQGCEASGLGCSARTVLQRRTYAALAQRQHLGQLSACAKVVHSTAFDHLGPGRAALRVAHCGRTKSAAEP